MTNPKPKQVMPKRMEVMRATHTMHLQLVSQTLVRTGQARRCSEVKALTVISRPSCSYQVQSEVAEGTHQPTTVMHFLQATTPPEMTPQAAIIGIQTAPSMYQRARKTASTGVRTTDLKLTRVKNFRWYPQTPTTQTTIFVELPSID